MSHATGDIGRFLAYTHERIDSALDRLLPPASAEPRSIHEALRYSIFPGGKRVRPAVMLLAVEATGGKPDAHIDAAAGFEMIHTSSLILDDLPSQDNSAMRHGQPACHVQFGEATAVLASTALLTLGIRSISLTAARENVASAASVRILRLVADSIGTQGMIGGQIADLGLDARGATMESLEYIHRHKTGALFTACAQTGALLAGAEDAQIAALTEWAKNVGLAYQIADDVLDAEGTAEVLGKPVRQDVGKATFVGVFGLDVSKRIAGELYAASVVALDMFGARKEKLVALTRWLETRTK